ncbi:hypothetical protein BJ944DRAFT_253705 [Cunninghamella echinulata]|nr:hypothetical protein BJ944DRAFT_253705 [Cunninghamella echinulata]
MDEAMSVLENFAEFGNMPLINHFVSKALWILDRSPHYGKCYYILAIVLLHLQEDYALIVIKEGKRMDPSFEPLITLENTILQDMNFTESSSLSSSPSYVSPFTTTAASTVAPIPITTSSNSETSVGHHYHQNHNSYGHQNSYSSLSFSYGSMNSFFSGRRRSSLISRAPVLDDDETSLSKPLLDVLNSLFDDFDQDKDNVLNFEELDRFVFATNGQHPSREWLLAMGKRYGCNEQGWLTRDGYLTFFLEQTVNDQDETRKDIAAHGYNRFSLRKS